MIQRGCLSFAFYIIFIGLRYEFFFAEYLALQKQNLSHPIDRFPMDFEYWKNNILFAAPLFSRQWKFARWITRLQSLMDFGRITLEQQRDQSSRRFSVF